jgi:hypothetical protein
MFGFPEGGASMDEILTASQAFRTAKAELLAMETEYRRLQSDEAARAVNDAMLRFDLARLALRAATRSPLVEQASQGFMHAKRDV